MEQSIRRKIELDQFYELCKILEFVDDHSLPTVKDAELKKIGVVRSADLDVDGVSPCDFEPPYFTPWHPDETPDLLEIGSNESWLETMDKDKATNPEWCPNASYVYPQHKVGWFLRCVRKVDKQLGQDDFPDDEFEDYGEGSENDDHDQECKDGGNGNAQPSHQNIKRGYQRPCVDEHVYKMPSVTGWRSVAEYVGSGIRLPRAKNLPHASINAYNGRIAEENKMLLSELDNAARAIKHQVRNGYFTNHHTKPVLVFSIQHESYGRIVQAHFDTKINKLVVHHSRILDLRGPKPTPDAYIPLRWMLNTPTGQTEYPPEIDTLEAKCTEPPASSMQV